MKIVIPMAGAGSRFSKTGVTLPKPLIDVEGRPMVAWALEGLSSIPRSLIVFVVLKEHDRRFRLRSILQQMVTTNHEVVTVPEVTEGQLVTVMAARQWIDEDEDVLIASSDTLVRSDLADDIACRDPDCRGIISVARLPGERWSFARAAPDGVVVEVAEKKRISDLASTGIYYFSSGRELTAIAEDMIHRDERTRGEFYVIPVYRQYIERGWKVEVSMAEEVWDMGTPDALDSFRQHLRATAR